MRKLIVALALCSASLSGCAAVPAVLGMAAPIIATQEKVVLQGSKALVVANYAYNSVASTANEVAKACLANANLPCPISAANATRLRQLNAQATQALFLAKATSDEVVKAREAAKVMNIVDTIRALIGR